MGLGQIGDFVSGFWSALWPPRCPLCSELIGEGDGIRFCRSCLEAMPAIAPPLCRVCGRGMNAETGPPSGVCGFCELDPPPFDHARAFGIYQGGLAQAIRDFKFKGKRALAPALSRLLEAAAASIPDGINGHAVLPLPLHPRRLQERGFNQAADLGRALARTRGLPLLQGAVIRARDTQPQVGLSLPQRRENLQNAFQVKRPDQIAGQTLILVDDVLTTGVTAGECARALKKAGAEKVILLTLARTI